MFGAYYFDGTNDYINRTELKEMNSLPFSVSYWLNASPKDSGTAGTVCKYMAASTNGYCSHGVHSNTLFYLKSWFFSDASNNIRMDGIDLNTTLETNKWYHIVDIVNYTGMYRYVNGKLNLSNTTWAGTPQDSTETTGIYIGTYPTTGSPTASPFNGTIDDLRIYNKSLSPEQIKFLFENKTHFVSSADTEYNKVYKCAVTPINQNGAGSTLNSTALLVLGSAIPKINNVTIHPNSTNTYYGTQVNCSTNVTIDSAIAILNFVWYKDGIRNNTINSTINPVVTGTYWSKYNLTQHYQDVGSNYTCGVIINDGYNPLVYRNSSITFINSTMWNGTIIPALNANITNNLNISLKYEGQTGNIIFKWYKNAILWVTKTIIGVTSGTWVSDVLGWGNYTLGDNITVIVSTPIENLSLTSNITHNMNIFNMTTIYNVNVTESSVQLISGNITFNIAETEKINSLKQNLNATILIDNTSYSPSKQVQTNSIWFNYSRTIILGKQYDNLKWNITFNYNEIEIINTTPNLLQHHYHYQYNMSDGYGTNNLAPTCTVNNGILNSSYYYTPIGTNTTEIITCTLLGYHNITQSYVPITDENKTFIFSKKQLTANFFLINGSIGDVTGFWTDGNTTKNFTKISSIKIELINITTPFKMYFGFDDNYTNRSIYNYTQFYQMNNDWVTNTIENLTILNTSRTLYKTYFRVLSESANPLNDAIIKIFAVDTINGGNYTTIGQKFSGEAESNGMTYFWIDSYNMLQVVTTLDGYTPDTRLIHVDSAIYDSTNPITIILKKGASITNKMVTLFVCTTYNENSTTIPMIVHAPSRSLVKFNTSFSSTLQEISLNANKIGYPVLTQGTHYCTNCGDDLIINLYEEDETFINTYTVEWEDYTEKISTPSGLDTGTKRKVAWIGLILITGVIGLIFKKSDETTSSGSIGKSAFFIGMLVIGILFLGSFNFFFPIIFIYVMGLALKKWVSE